MTTSEVMKELGITKQALIFYEKEGLIKPARDANNYRSYSSEDLDVLKFILLMRTMEISIDEIKLILNNQLSIRDALEAKKEMIYVSKDKLDDISDKINQYMLRRKVNIVLDGEVNNEYENLYVHNDCIKFESIIIYLRDINSIKLGIDASKFGDGYYDYHFYYVDLDIITAKDTYSFQLMNNNKVNPLFEVFINAKIDINDPLNLIQIYQQFDNDMVGLYRYINNHFKKWKDKQEVTIHMLDIKNMQYYGNSINYKENHRIKSYFSMDNKNEKNTLLFTDNNIVVKDTRIPYSSIQEIHLSLCSRIYNPSIKSSNLIKLMIGLIATGIAGTAPGSHMMYCLDMDIYTKDNEYYFESYSLNNIKEILDILKNNLIEIHDAIGIYDMLKNYTDKVELQKYLDNHFRQIAKEYHLDNPRGVTYNSID
ncbi:MAG: MerR family transcriptional regulator [Erysipelotrichaceae bacterium]|nr:MerR family transcriptional regulator [Erysipelotrichaceae bacterium]